MRKIFLLVVLFGSVISSLSHADCTYRGYNITFEIKNNTNHQVEITNPTNNQVVKIDAGKSSPPVLVSLGSSDPCEPDRTIHELSVPYNVVGTSQSGFLKAIFDGCESPNIRAEATPTDRTFGCSYVASQKTDNGGAQYCGGPGGYCVTTADCGNAQLVCTSSNVCLWKDGTATVGNSCDICASGHCQTPCKNVWGVIVDGTVCCG